MRISGLILTVGMLGIMFIVGCQKPKTVQISKHLHKKETGREQKDTEEARALFEELKKKNPFRPDHFSGLSQAAVGSDLKGITWDSSRPFAIIGSKVVMEGDSVDGKKVIKINKDSVILEEGGRQIILRLE